MRPAICQDLVALVGNWSGETRHSDRRGTAVAVGSDRADLPICSHRYFSCDAGGHGHGVAGNPSKSRQGAMQDGSMSSMNHDASQSDMSDRSGESADSMGMPTASQSLKIKMIIVSAAARAITL